MSEGVASKVSVPKVSVPKVSVIVPVYNGERHLPTCLDCVLSQSYQNWELVVIDNNSDDGTAAVIERYLEMDARIRSYRNPETVPVIENHNIAASHMAADAIWCKVLHVDDYLEPTALERMVEVGVAHPDVGVVGAWTQLKGRLHGKIEPSQQCRFEGAEIARRTLMGEVYPFHSPSCLLIRSDLIRQRESFYSVDGLHADVDAMYELLEVTNYGCAQAELIRVGRPNDSVTSSVVLPMNKLLASNLELLLRHGPRYLSEDELQRRRAEHLTRYKDFLAAAWLEGRSCDFWDFHLSALERLGLPVSRADLVRHRCSWIVHDPRRAIHHLAKRYKSS